MSPHARKHLDATLQILGPWRALWGLLAWDNRNGGVRPSSRGILQEGCSCFLGEACGGEWNRGVPMGHPYLQLRQEVTRTFNSGRVRDRKLVAIEYVFNAFEEPRFRRAALPIVRRFVERHLLK